MELRHLRYFARVAEELHFGRAARHLGISQPPLSQQVRALEIELGVDLFDRTSRRVELTEAGRLFLPEALRTLEQASHAIDVVRRAHLGETGALSIAFTTSVPFIPMIARAFGAYRQAYPAIHLSLAELGRDEQIAGIAGRRIDIGFVRGFETPPLPDGLIATQLLEEPLVVAIHEDHPLARENRPLGITDIADLPFVLYHHAIGVGFNEQITSLFRRHKREFRVAQEVSGVASLLGLIAAGLGVSIIVRSLAALQADHMVYRTLDEPDALSRLWMVRRATLSGRGAEFRRCPCGRNGPSRALIADDAADPICPGSGRKRLSLPTQSHDTLRHEPIDGGVHDRHRIAPILLRLGMTGDSFGHFAGTDSGLRCAGGEERQRHVTGIFAQWSSSVGIIGVRTAPTGQRASPAANAAPWQSSQPS